MAEEYLRGAEKAAIFLFGLGEELASEIVKNLDEAEMKKLGGCMSKIASVTPENMDSVFSEFYQMAASDPKFLLNPLGRDEFVKNVFTKAVKGDRAQALLDEIQQKGKWNLFQKIRKLDAKTLANFIRSEHPQTIAVVLAHLDAGQTAAILEELPLPLQTDVIYRIAQLDNVPPGILAEIDQTIQEEMSLIENIEGNTVGGIRSAAEILNQMKSTTENEILQAIDEQKQGLADEIRQWMFVFEDLVQVDDRSIMAILREVDSDTLKLALRTVSEELKEKIFKNMSERAATMMKEDLEVMGPVRLKDVEAAQQTIIRIGKKLESEGKAALTTKGKEDVFV
jgi:flagellar motor switch protein FliG